LRTLDPFLVSHWLLYQIASSNMADGATQKVSVYTAYVFAFNRSL